jgi:3-hydroxyacyl-CoA dehydrogenase
VTARALVVGAGVMGAGIAQTLAVAGLEVVCQDVDPAALERAEAMVTTGRYGLDSAVARGRLDQAAAAAARARLTFARDLGAAESADVVIEAVPEDLGLKVAVFRELDGCAGPETVLATNSSGFPVAALAAATGRPDRVVGWHWASPAPVMRLAEIVRGPATSQRTVDRVCELAHGAGKNPVVVQDQPTSWGYVANRVYAAMFREAERVVAEGVATADQVNQLMVDCFRWPAGPFAMVDASRTGWDTAR